MREMPANPIQLLGAGLVVTVGLAATSGAVSAPATGSRLAADAAQGKSKIALIRPGPYGVPGPSSHVRTRRPEPAHHPLPRPNSTRRIKQTVKQGS